MEQRALEQKFFGEQIAAQGLLVGSAAGFAQADLEQLAAVVPLVDRLPQVQPLIALQTQKRAAQRAGAGGGDSGFADPGFAFEQDRALQ